LDKKQAKIREAEVQFFDKNCTMTMTRPRPRPRTRARVKA
jgi:hypothetical protein